MFSVLVLILFSISSQVVFASEPLLLTPLIEKNGTEAARKASSVNPEIFLNITSYSGFLTVNKEYNSNMFFWYFPNAKRDLTETPWIIWLQGGSILYRLMGRFAEMGPFEYVNDSLKLREHSWCTEFSMVFIDNLIGSGFSFTDSDNGYPRNMEMFTQDLYNVVKQLVVLYPELGKAPLYVAGESYVGHYVPALAARIAERKNIDNTINLQGIMMGNPTLDSTSIVDFTRVLYDWGLLDTQGALTVKPLQDAFDQAVKRGDNEAAAHLHNELLWKLSTITKNEELFEYDADLYNDFIIKARAQPLFIETPAIREAIHVGDQRYSLQDSKPIAPLTSDFLANELEQLLENYRVLIYCGQLDLMPPCALNAEARRRKWRWSGRDDFLQATRTPWWHNNVVAGYVKSGGNFSEVLVMRAGHLVPIDKPAEAHIVISHFIRGQELSRSLRYELQLQKVTFEEYRDINDQLDSGVNSGLIVSIVLNVLLAIGIVVGIAMFVKWKRHIMIQPYDDSVRSVS